MSEEGLHVNTDNIFFACWILLIGNFDIEDVFQGSRKTGNDDNLCRKFISFGICDSFVS